jgi:hypothetical protein
MKTKYSQLLKLRKQQVDSIENKIAILNKYKEMLNDEIMDISKDADSLQMPKKGKFKKLLAQNHSFEILMNLKREKEFLLLEKSKEIQNAQSEYKIALMEFEKIKYLEDLQVQKKLEKLKKDEQKMLDEVSTMNYKRRSI